MSLIKRWCGALEEAYIPGKPISLPVGLPRRRRRMTEIYRAKLTISGRRTDSERMTSDVYLPVSEVGGRSLARSLGGLLLRRTLPLSIDYSVLNVSSPAADAFNALTTPRFSRQRVKMGLRRRRQVLAGWHAAVQLVTASM